MKIKFLVLSLLFVRFITDLHSEILLDSIKCENGFITSDWSWLGNRAQ